MHSRIFQIEDAPVLKKHYIGTGDFEEGFVGSVADYVADSDDRDGDIKWLVSNFEAVTSCDSLLIGCSLVQYNSADNSIVFLPGFKEGYFKSKFDELKRLTSRMTLHEFANNAYDVYQIEKCILSKFGFYVSSGPSGTQSMDEFIRSEVKENTKYYFGNTIDYHS